MRKILDFYKVRFVIILFLTVVVLTSLAWHNRFIWDDPFISFRYAYNLVHGNGLVWNVGERVEGYTNFLWTLLMCIPLYLGYGPVTFSLLLGIVFFIFSLVFTYKTSLLVFHSRDTGLLTIVLLGTNYTFSSFATSGLETQMQASLFVMSIYVLFRCIETNDWNTLWLLMSSLLLSAALLTRLDSALLVIVIFPFALFFILKDRMPMQQKVKKVLVLLVPFTVLIGGWFIWKLFYYGDILPNTFYVKATNPSPRLGIDYLYLFFISYLLVPFPFLFILALKRFFKKTNLKMIALIVVILLWILYVIKIGGDYMEFRFMVPIMPLLFIVLVWLVFVFIQQKEIRVALILLVLSGSLHHTFTFGEYTNRKHIVSLDQVVRFNTSRDKTWPMGQIGMALGRSFHYSPDVTIALYAVGGIPYYSRLKTIDMSGLNDKWVARYGDFMGYFPGHQRTASIYYLHQRMVNLVINAGMRRPFNAPQTKYSADYIKDFFWPATINPDEIPADAKMIEMPINKDYFLEVLYLTRNPVVDEAIRRNRWNVYSIVRNQ